MDLEKQIIKDILRKRRIIKQMKEIIEDDDLMFFHFGIGKYIRNKYLWQYPENIKILSDLYGISNVDDISFVLAQKIYFKVTGKQIKRDIF